MWCLIVSIPDLCPLSFICLLGIQSRATIGPPAKRHLMVVWGYILKPTANWSPYIFTLVQKVKRRVYKVHIFLSEGILCGDSASYFI